MKVLFNSCFSAFFQKGGGEVQLLKTKEALENKGLEIQLYNHWHPQLDFDIFHQFTIEAGVEQIVKRYKEIGKKIALSPIMWNLPPKDHWEFFRIKSIIDCSDIIFTNSNIESERLADWFNINSSKFHKTINSISEEYLTEGDSSIFRNKFNIGGMFVLSVANIDKRKNTHELILACREIGINLITIGHIKDKDYYDSFQNIYSNYLHLGPIEDVEVLKSAYRACSVFCLPSQCETPGIAALEAASQGANIIVTKEGSAPEYFGEYAQYSTPGNVSELSSLIRDAFNLFYSDKLQRYVRTSFRWEITSDEVISGYRKIR